MLGASAQKKMAAEYLSLYRQLEMAA